MPGALSNFYGIKGQNLIQIRNVSNRLLFRSRPRAVMVVQNQSYWTTIEAEIEANLKKSLQVRQPESVFEPLHHLALSPPQTAASALCVAACELISPDGRDQAMDAAVAIHLMHAALHAHWHLPLSTPVPGSGRPAIPHRFGPNVELLTGDALMPLGLEMLARSVDFDPARNNPDKILRVIIEITRASGSQGVVDRKRGGALHACGAACGAIIGGGNEEEIERLRNYGNYIGMICGMVRMNNEEINELRVLAMKELEIFKEREVIGQISSLLERDFCTI